MHSSRSKDKYQNPLQMFSGTTSAGSGLLASTSSYSKGLSKFLKRDIEESFDPNDHSLIDKMLIEFPVFALNDDYMKALASIIQNKIDQIKIIIEEKQEELNGPAQIKVEDVGSGSATAEKAIKLSSKPPSARTSTRKSQ